MGAIGDTYATLEELKDYLSIKQAETRFDELLSAALDSASREVERSCNRQFNKADTASPRVYEPKTWREVDTDDFWDPTDMVVEFDSAGDGSFSLTVPNNQFEVFPHNGIVDGQPGWPYRKIRTTTGLRFFKRQWYGNLATVRVTAKWGWPQVPAPVHQATMILAAEAFQIKDAPLGVAGAGAFGAVIKVSDNRMAATKLMRYTRDPVLVG